MHWRWCLPQTGLDVADIRVHIDTLEYTRDGLKSTEPIPLQVGEHNRVVLVRPERSRPSSAGMGGFAVDSSFPTPASLAVFLSLSLGDALVELFNGLFGKDGQPDTRVFQLYGHADRTGDEAGNKALAEDRAEALRAILVRDIDAFVALGEREAWGLTEQQVMLRTLKCDPGPIDGEPGAMTELATTDFQTDYVAGVFHRHTDLEPRDPGLVIDGDLGAATNTALLEALVMGCSPGISPDALHPTHPSVGCSEYNRISEDVPALNRRVTLLVHDQLPPYHEAAPCRQQDHGACPFDDRDRSGCLWYREHVQDPVEAEFVHHHYDLRWLPLSNGGVLLSALTTLQDDDEVSFEVFRTGDVSGPEDVREENIDATLSGPLTGIVRKGVAQVVWMPAEGGEDQEKPFDPFDIDDWYVPVDFEAAVADPGSVWRAGPTLRPPVFEVRGGGASTLSKPPGQDPHRIRVESGDGAPLDDTLHAVGIDIYGRLLDVPLQDGRSTSERSMRDEAFPVIQFEVRGAHGVEEETES